MKCAIEPHLNFNMMRFRLGCWYLRANDLKLKSTNISRGERVCQLCLRVRHKNLVEDEEHVVFECPSFECVRNKYRDLFLEQTKLNLFNL